MSLGLSGCPEREILDESESTEKRISDHHSSCLALPTRITAPAHQQRLLIGRVSGLVFGESWIFADFVA